MWLVVFASLAGGLCVYAALWRLRTVRRADDGGVVSLAERVSRPSRSRLAALRDELPRDGLAGRLLAATLDARSRDAAVADINELLADAAADLDRGATVPRGASRVTLAVGVVLAVVGLIRELGSPGVDLVLPGSAFAVGAVCSIACAQVGRIADETSTRQKGAINAVVRACVGVLPEAEGPSRARGRLEIE